MILENMMKSIIGIPKQRIKTASNGLEALEMATAEENKFDIIITDLNMPLMNGLVSSRKIKSHFKKIGT